MGIFAWSLDHFAQRYDYDVDYLHEMEADAPGSLWRYLLLAPLSQRCSTAPPEAYFTAKLLATQQQDCGPCVRLVVNMAVQAGVDKNLLLGLLRGDADDLHEDTVLVINFTRQILAQESATDYGAAIAQRWGAGAVADLSLAIAFGGFYPTLKRGLGHAQSCEPVVRELTAAIDASAG